MSQELTTSEVAALLGVKPDVLRKWKYRGFLPSAPAGVSGQGRSVECFWSEAAVAEARAHRESHRHSGSRGRPSALRAIADRDASLARADARGFSEGVEAAAAKRIWDEQNRRAIKDGDEPHGEWWHPGESYDPDEDYEETSHGQDRFVRWQVLQDAKAALTPPAGCGHKEVEEAPPLSRIAQIDEQTERAIHRHIAGDAGALLEIVDLIRQRTEAMMPASRRAREPHAGEENRR